MDKHTLEVDVVACDGSGPEDASIKAWPGGPPKIKLDANGAVCITKDHTGRSSVDFTKVAPGKYTGDIEPGQWLIQVSVAWPGGGWSQWQYFDIMMPDHDASMKDLVR